uniref:Uncharacterized protein n=1 Tax=Cacopsylla melanoneura TaxID=428564 RepID=A0A8D9E959_9HEMI
MNEDSMFLQFFCQLLSNIPEEHLLILDATWNFRKTMADQRFDSTSVVYYAMYTIFLLVAIFFELEFLLLLKYHAITAKYKIYALYFLVRSTLQVEVLHSTISKRVEHKQSIGRSPLNIRYPQ